MIFAELLNPCIADELGHQNPFVEINLFIQHFFFVLSELVVEYIELVLNHCGYNLTFIQYSIEIASVFDQVRLLRPLNQDFVF